MGKRAQRIPSWPGVIHSNKGRIHLRRPTCDILTIRLRRSGGPYIPVSRPLVQNRWISLATKHLHARSRSYGDHEKPSGSCVDLPGVGPTPPAAGFAYHMESVACGPESSTRPIANYN